MKAQKIRAGASGFSFREWKGSFYPEKIKADAMLQFYGERLPTVEINSSYYAMPKTASLEKWREVTPATFRFAIKAPAEITHKAKLKAELSAEPLAVLYERLATLGTKRGAVLFQLPPYLKKDLSLLKEFLSLLPEDHRAAFEFRNDSWFCDETYTALRNVQAALVWSEREDNAPPPLVETAPWGYLRLRLEHYSEADLQRWAERLTATSWCDLSVFFMHEPTAPEYAQILMRQAAGKD